MPITFTPEILPIWRSLQGCSPRFHHKYMCEVFLTARLMIAKDWDGGKGRCPTMGRRIHSVKCFAAIKMGLFMNIEWHREHA